MVCLLRPLTPQLSLWPSSFHGLFCRLEWAHQNRYHPSRQDRLKDTVHLSDPWHPGCGEAKTTRWHRAVSIAGRLGLRSILACRWPQDRWPKTILSVADDCHASPSRLSKRLGSGTIYTGTCFVSEYRNIPYTHTWGKQTLAAIEAYTTVPGTLLHRNISRRTP